MPHPRPLRHQPDAQERRQTAIENDQEEATELEERIERAGEWASPRS